MVYSGPTFLLSYLLSHLLSYLLTSLPITTLTTYAAALILFRSALICKAGIATFLDSVLASSIAGNVRAAGEAV